MLLQTPLLYTQIEEQQQRLVCVCVLACSTLSLEVSTSLMVQSALAQLNRAPVGSE